MLDVYAEIPEVPFGKQIHENIGTAKLRKRANLLDSIERHRVPTEMRDMTLRVIVSENKERWGTMYEKYKDKMRMFARECESWRVVCTAYGKDSQHHWPISPMVPRFPETLCYVRESRMKDLIRATLKKHHKLKNEQSVGDNEKKAEQVRVVTL